MIEHEIASTEKKQEVIDIFVRDDGSSIKEVCGCLI